MMFHANWSRETATMLGVLAVQATVLLAATQIASWALRKLCAAARHRLWTLAMLGLLGLPLLSLGAPTVWTIHVPPPLAAAAPAAAPSELAGDPGVAGLSPRHAGPTPSNGPGGIASAASESLLSTDSPGRPVSQPTAQRPFAAQRAGRLWPLVWAVGVGFCLLGLALSAWRVRSLQAATKPLASSALQSLCDELAARLGVRAQVTLREHAAAIVPLTFGVWRPAIALPREVHEWSAARRRMVLLHELGHIRRHDVAWHWLGQFACALYWFHPLAWLGLKQLRREAEQACDDLVLHSGERASDYAAELVAVARLFHGYAWAQVVAMARRGSLEGRLRSLLDADVVRSHAPLKRRSAWLLLGAALFGTSIASAVRLAGQPPVEAPPKAVLAAPPVDDEPVPIDLADTTPPRTATVLDHSVLVVDSQGRPVVGARLLPWGFGTADGTGWAWVPGWPKEFQSNAEGVARILVSEEQTALVPPEHGDFTFLSFRLEHPDFAWIARSYRLLSAEEPLVLAEGFVIVPRVVDALSGTPITDDLFAYSSGASPDAWLNESGELSSPRLDPQAPESGRYFRIVHVPPESPDSPVLFSDVIDIRNLQPADGVARPEIPLHAGVRLRGRLAADVPRPIRGGRVLLQILNDSYQQWPDDCLLWIDETSINAAGEFEFPSVPRRSHVELLALCEGWVSTRSSADAAAYDAQHGTSFLEQADDGQTSAGGGLTASTPVRVEEQPVETTLPMRRTVACEVRVVDEEGHPVDRAVVTLWPNQTFRSGSNVLGSGGNMLHYLGSGQLTATDGPENAATARFTRVTDAQGRATIQDVPLGREMANIEYPGYAVVPNSELARNFPFAVVEVRADDPAVQELQLQRLASLPDPPPARLEAAAEPGAFQFTLRVVDHEGAPLPGARVSMRGQDLQRPGERQPWPNDWPEECTTNDAGLIIIRVELPLSADLQALGACSFWLDVEHDGCASVSDYQCSLSRPLPVRLLPADDPE